MDVAKIGIYMIAVGAVLIIAAPFVTGGEHLHDSPDEIVIIVAILLTAGQIVISIDYLRNNDNSLLEGINQSFEGE